MRVTVIKPNGLHELRHMDVGSNVRGLRIESITFEGPRELDKLNTIAGQMWLQSSVRYCFLPENKF